MGNEIKKCVIISGAPENDIEYYLDLIKARYIICADSGYKKCLKLKITPNLIIGDFDSSDKPTTDIETIVLPVKKDDTDTFYAVKRAIEIGFEDIIILGGIGSRIDHTYSNIMSVLYCFERDISCKLINKNNEIFVIDSYTKISKDKYNFFSLFALFEKCTGVTIKGAVYNIDDIDISPNEQFAQSNAFESDTVEINLKSGKLLVIKSND